MTSKIDSELASSAQNDDSDEEKPNLINYEEEKDEDHEPSIKDEKEEQDFIEEEEEEEEEEQNSVDKDEEDEEVDDRQQKPINVVSLAERLQFLGASIKRTNQEYCCLRCDLDFSNWADFQSHHINHVSKPFVALDKLPSDEEDLPQSGDENWSDEDEEPSPPKPSPAKTPQKIDISQILKKTGISLKKPSENNSNTSDSLHKLSGLGLCIKKNVTPIKKEKTDNDTEKSHDMVHKLGQLGGIKLKLKSDGNNTNSFKVVNGLKDFKASDDEDESGEEELKEEHDSENEINQSGENDGSGEEHDSHRQQNNRTRSNSRDSDTSKNVINKKQIITPKKEPSSTPKKVTPIKIQKEDIIKVMPVNIRPAVKQTPKRATMPVGSKEQGNEALKKLSQTRTADTGSNSQTPTSDNSRRKSVSSSSDSSRKNSQTATLDSSRRPSAATPDTSRRPSQTATPNSSRRPSQAATPDSFRTPSQAATPERPQSNERAENVVVKQEVQETSGDDQNKIPLFSGTIKSERSTPPLAERTTPILAHVKSEPEVSSSSSTQPLFSYQTSNSANNSTTTTTTPLLPVTKSEVTIIEINGDSNDEDDDCCVVSTTPAPDVKPIVPKIENTTSLPPAYPTTPSYTTSQSSFNTASSSSSSRVSSAPSTEKQHSFNWNAPDSKPSMDFLEKSADDIFESLLSSSSKKENMSLSDASEYISLDTLGPQHSCDICNTRFTDISLLEEHIRMTGHSKTLVSRTPTSTLMPYDPSQSLLSSLLPVKQIAEQVGKLSTIGSSGPGYTHQQNVMINIQAYPGAAGGVMVPPQYNAYGTDQGAHGSYPQASGNLYGNPPMTIPNQYSSAPNFMNPGYGQYQAPMSKPGYPTSMPPNSYSMASSQYTNPTPLQSMQQTVYGQVGGMMNTPGAMGPPGASPNHAYASTSSPGGLKQQSGAGIKIQNVQTFPPGHMPGQMMPGQPQPGQPMTSGAELGMGQMATGQVQGGTPIRMAAGANIAGIRPRMPTVRGQRPTIRPGIQVHGQVRGAKMGGPRMPLKRPGAMMAGPGQKRRPSMLLPGKHDNEDCQVMSMQKQRDGLPMIQSVQGAKDKLNLGGQISITKKPAVNKEANAMANVLASRGISVKQKQKSRSPTPDRPLPHIPNLGAGISIKHTSRSSKFSITEAKVGNGMYTCKICKKMCMNHNSLQVHMANAHPQSKIPVFKCDECPASYPKSLQLQHHKRVFHNVTGPNRELGLPVVDLSQEDNLKRLSSLGIYSFIPLANREQANGCFGIPVISVHNMQNGLTSSLQALGADGLLSLGPLKPLPNA